MTNAHRADAITFKFSDTQHLRSTLIEGAPWFVASDAIKILSLDRKTMERLDDDEKGVNSIHTLGGMQKMIIISESGLYSLILSSRKPEAKKFKKWVTSEVLPSIRKTGSYDRKPADPIPLPAEDMRHIKRMVQTASKFFRYESIWNQAIWAYLRHILNVPSPAPFEPRHMPALALELAKVNSVAWQVRETLEYVERQAVRLILRNGREVGPVIAELRQAADARLADTRDWISRLPVHLIAEMQAAYDRDHSKLGHHFAPDEAVALRPVWAPPLHHHAGNGAS